MHSLVIFKNAAKVLKKNDICNFFHTFSGIWRIFVPAFGAFLFRHLAKFCSGIWRNLTDGCLLV